MIAHPFRLVGSTVATVEQASDAGLIQSVAVLATTRRGERPLVPSFGITDPAFHSVSQAEINAGLALFGPDVTVEQVHTEPLGGGRTAVDLIISVRGS